MAETVTQETKLHENSKSAIIVDEKKQDAEDTVYITINQPFHRIVPIKQAKISLILPHKRQNSFKQSFLPKRLMLKHQKEKDSTLSSNKYSVVMSPMLGGGTPLSWNQSNHFKNKILQNSLEVTKKLSQIGNIQSVGIQSDPSIDGDSSDTTDAQALERKNAKYILNQKRLP